MKFNLQIHGLKMVVSYANKELKSNNFYNFENTFFSVTGFYILDFFNNYAGSL